MARAPKTFRARFELPEGTEHYVDPVDDDEGTDSDSEPMTEEQLASLVDGQINDAKSYEASDLIRLRERALKYFEGEVDIPAAAGRSSVVSRDVADQHGLIMPSLMRVFLATDNIAIYNPVQQSDEQFARQATDYVNYVVMRECSGYVQFRSAFHNGLLMGNGPIKHWWDDTPQYSTESFSGLSDDAYTMLVMDEDVEVIEHDEYDDPSGIPQPPMMPGMGDPMGGMNVGMDEQMMPVMPKLHDCKLKRMTSSGRLRVMALAPEDLLLGRGVLSLDEDSVRFVAHRWVKTRSELIKEGYDPDKVDDLPAYSSVKSDSPEAIARDREHLYEGDNPPDRSTDLIQGYECYIQCDYDGDGVAEWRKVVTAGEGNKTSLLDHEEWGDDLPFSDIVPDPVPHRWRGRSLFDSMEDIQKIKSVLMRQSLDGIYIHNNPTRYVLENQVANPEALEEAEIGTTVIEKTQGAVRWEVAPFVADKIFAAMEYMDGVAEKRTGISRQTLALDPSVLQDQTATAVNATQSAISTKVEEYARNIAEHGGMQRVFAKILKLIVKHQDRARTVRLRGKWVEIDPRAWNANMDVTVNTGLGSGSRERDLNMLMGVAAKQEQLIMQLGPTNPILGIDKLLDTYRLMVEAAGLKPADRFFPEVKPEVMQQMAQMASQKVDPKMQIAQMQQQADMQKAQMQQAADQQAEQVRAQTDAQKMQLQAQLEQMSAAAKAETDRQQAEFQQRLSAAKMQHDAQLQQMQYERQAQVEERQAQTDIAVQGREAQFKAQLAQMQFQHDQAMEQQKFEFQKKLELLKLWGQQRVAASKSAAEGGQSGASAPDIEFDEKLASEGIEHPVPEHNTQGPLQQVGHQLVQALTGFGQQLAQGHAAHSNTLASVLEELTKPKRQRVVRDENNRVIGSESY